MPASSRTPSLAMSFAPKMHAKACLSAMTTASPPIASPLSWPKPSAPPAPPSGSPTSPAPLRLSLCSSARAPPPPTPLPARQPPAAAGMVITASHNPYRWNGIKYKASYGSSALPSIVAQIETEISGVQRDGLPPLPPRKDLIQPLEPRAPYLDAIEKLVDWDRLRKAKFGFVSDAMH